MMRALVSLLQRLYASVMREAAVSDCVTGLNPVAPLSTILALQHLLIREKLFNKFGGLLFKLACMKITLFNFVCIELYAKLEGSFKTFGGSFWYFWG